MAPLVALASLLAILSLSTSRFCPLASLLPPFLPLSGWHPTAPHWLAPYCYCPAGTLLLIIVDWHPHCLVPPVTHLPLSLLQFTLGSHTWLKLQLIIVLHCLPGLS